MAKAYIYDESTDSLDELKVGGGGLIDTSDLELAIQQAQQTANGAATTASNAQAVANEAKAGLADKLDKTGTAAAATKLATSRTISLTGDASGSASFDGTANAAITTTLANSGVTAGSYGPSSNSSPAHEGTFTVPQVTVDAKGRVTSAVNRTITLPSAGTSSDTEVTQTVTTTDNTYPLLFTYTANQTATATSGVRFASAVKVNPSTQQIIAKGFQTDSGAYHSSFPFPSTTKVTLTLGASGATYTAPGDGWYVLKKEFASQDCATTFQGSAFMTMTTWASPLNQEDPKFISTVIGPYCNYGGTVFAPVVKGDTIKVLYDAAGTTDFFYFVYAMGAV